MYLKYIIWISIPLYSFLIGVIITHIIIGVVVPGTFLLSFIGVFFLGLISSFLIKSIENSLELQGLNTPAKEKLTKRKIVVDKRPCSTEGILSSERDSTEQLLRKSKNGY